jgi:hypothetical protein
MPLNKEELKMLDANIKTQLRCLPAKKCKRPDRIGQFVSTTAIPRSEMLALLQEIATLSDAGQPQTRTVMPFVNPHLPLPAQAKSHASALPASRWGTNSLR